MSGIEAVGLVLGLWPIMINLVDAYKAGKSGSSLTMLRMNIMVQEKIFKQSIQKLLQGDEKLSDKDKVGLIRSNTNFAAIWTDPEFVDRLERRLDDETLAILKYKSVEISKILTTLRKKIEKNPEEPMVCHSNLDRLVLWSSIALKLTLVIERTRPGDKGEHTESHVTSPTRWGYQKESG